MSALDSFGRVQAKPSSDYAAAVVGAAVTRINVGGSSNTFILKV